MTSRTLDKLNVAQVQPTRQPVWRGLVRCGYGLLLVVTMLFTGCRKADQSVAPATPPAPVADTNQAAAVAPVYSPSQPPPPMQATAVDPDARPLVKPNGEPDLHQLDQVMLGWLVSNRRRPSSFAEFAATAGVTIPPPPAGKKYSINKNMHVILVDR